MDMDMKWRRWTLAAAAAALCIVMSAGCSMFSRGEPQTFAEDGGVPLARGKSAMLAGDFESARPLLEEAAEKGESAEARYYLALIEFGGAGPGGSAGAMRQVQLSLTAYPSAQGFLLQGAMQQATDPDAAMQSYRMGLAKAPANGSIAALLHRNMGVLLAGQGDWKGAREQFESYVSLARQRGRDLSDADLALWGLMLYRQGEQAQARSAWAGVKDAELRREIEAASSAKPTLSAVRQATGYSF